MLNIVLHEPLIPENTGNIARTCVAFNAKLHLIKPYGFFLNNKKTKRSGVDYWDKLNYQEYDSFSVFIKSIKKNDKIYYISRYGLKRPNKLKLNIKQNIYFVFGKETEGLPKTILKKHKKDTVRIPTSENVRSINLSNCVAIISYEYIKQTKYDGLSLIEPHKPLFIS